MRKKLFRKKALSILLAGTLTATSFGVMPSVRSYAGSTSVNAPRSFDSAYDEQYAYSGNDLGCIYTPDATTFKVWSPEATSVVLCRYDKGDGGSVIEEVAMTKGEKGVWSKTIQGDIVNTYYTYKVTVNGTTNEAVDIYAKAAGVNGNRAMVVDLDSTDPVNWDKNYERQATKLSDAIIWEIHIRDFSIDVSSGVSEANRGKYKAFTESTTVNGQGKVASCVDYLKKLGVTHVQILPMYDFASVDETTSSSKLGSNYNWGYDPKNYNVPEGSYSSNPYDGNVRIKEMKEMIQALHDAGIKVVMDVVYNHTYDTVNSNFNKIMPGYYYKLNSDLSYNNQSGCGNATRSESAMYRKFMIDSLTYWAGEYNLDGFRFDLMGIHDVTTMNEIRKALDDKFGEDTIIMYGEGWTGDGAYDSNSAHKANESKLDDGIGYFNDQIRDALKGEHKFDGTIGLVQTNYVSGSYLEPGQKWPNNVFGGIMGSVGFTEGEWGMWRPFWSKSSNSVVTYTSAHDNLTLWDKLTEGFGKNFNSTDEKLINMNKMAGAILLSSKGGVFFQAGEEFARTKNGDDNSYKSPDSVNKIDWNRVDTYSSIVNYYKGMIEIRKAFSGFRSTLTRSGDNWNPTNNNITWISKDETGMIAFYETNNVQGEWSKVAVLINNATTEKSVALEGANQWVIVADGSTAGTQKIKETSSTVAVPGKSVVVAVPKDTFDACDKPVNREPVIGCDGNYSVQPGESLSFTITVTDPEGDNVTLSAVGLPTGATFNTNTGVFNWDKAVEGSYTVTVSATDGQNITKKNVIITVKYKSDIAKESLQSALKDATDKLANAKTDSEYYNEFAIKDLEEVIADVEEFLKSTHTVEEYESKIEDITLADKACCFSKKNPFIRVKADGWTNPSIYIWKGDGETATLFAGSWPGTKLTTKDSQGWYVFDLPVGTTNYNLILNDGVASSGNQTSNIIGVEGNVNITVTSFTGKYCGYEKVESPVPIDSDVLETTVADKVIAQADNYIEQYKNNDKVKNEYDALCTSKNDTVKLKELESTTQVELNKSVRLLKKAIEILINSANNGDNPQPTKPEVILSAEDNKIDVSWTSVAGATKYRVYTYLDGKYTTQATVTGNSYTVNELNGNTRYGVLVRAYVDGAFTSYTTDDIKYVTVTGSAVKPVVTLKAGSGKIYATWTSVTGATKYRVYKYVGGKYTAVDTVTGTRLTITGLTGGVKTGILVRAYVNGAFASYSLEDNVYATPTVEVKPTVKVTSGNASLHVNWGAVNGATKYRVYYNVGGKYTTVATVTGLSCEISGLTNGTEYGVLVRAYINGAYTSYSNADLVKGTPSANVASTKPVVTLTAGNGKIDASWNSVNGATKYRVYKYVNGVYTKIGDTISTSMTVSGLANGTKCGILIRAYVNGAFTAYSLADNVYATPTA